MAQCEYCDSQVENGVTTCPNCSAPIPVSAASEDQYEPVSTGTTTAGSSPADDSFGDLAGMAMGALLTGMLRGNRRRRPPMQPPRGPMGPMGGFGGPRGPMGGPGGHRGGGRGPGGPGGPGGRR